MSYFLKLCCKAGVIAVLAMSIFVLVSNLSTAEAASANPQGWHLLYNVGMRQCLNLGRLPIFQRCLQTNLEQQYAVLAITDTANLIVNRSNASCLEYSIRASSIIQTHPVSIGQGDCSSAVPPALADRYGSMRTWLIADVGAGPGGYRNYQIAEGTMCLQPYSYQDSWGITEIQCNRGNQSQLWQFR